MAPWMCWLCDIDWRASILIGTAQIDFFKSILLIMHNRFANHRMQIDLLTLRFRSAFADRFAESTKSICILQIDLLTLRFRSAFCRSICWVYDFDLHFADRFADSTKSICILQIDFRLYNFDLHSICILQIDLLTQRFWSAFCRSIELTMHFPIDLPIDFAKQIDFYFWHKCHSILDYYMYVWLELHIVVCHCVL